MADRIKQKIKGKNVVIDSIRNPMEIQSLRQLDHFFLIAVDAPIELRYQRAKSRNRIENAESLQDFIKMENKEKSEIQINQNIAACIQQAEFKILNDGDTEKLFTKVEGILEELKNRIRPSWSTLYAKIRLSP